MNEKLMMALDIKAEEHDINEEYLQMHYFGMLETHKFTGKKTDEIVEIVFKDFNGK